MWPFFLTFSFCKDKCIVMGIVFYKHTSVVFLFFFVSVVCPSDFRQLPLVVI